LSERSKERNEALNLAQTLQMLADMDENYLFRSDLNKLVNKIRTFGARSHDRDVVAIMKAIKYNGCNSTYDICEQTKIPEAVVQEIVSDMVAESAAVLRPREGKGPKRMDVYLTGKPFQGFVA
jgi:hypothetical protein